MVATGLIEELQIPVMNHAQQFATPDCKIIPQSMDCLVEAVHVNDRFYGFKLPIPQYQYPGDDAVKVTPLSQSMVYRRVMFDQQTQPKVAVSFDLEMRTKGKSGKVNGIRLSNTTAFPDGSTLGGTDAYCYPLILPVPPVGIKDGDPVNLSLSYTMCGGFRTLNYSLTKK